MFFYEFSIKMQTAETCPIQKRVFIQRDYSDGMLVKFQTRFPTELDDRVCYLLFLFLLLLTAFLIVE